MFYPLLPRVACDSARYNRFCAVRAECAEPPARAHLNLLNSTPMRGKQAVNAPPKAPPKALTESVLRRLTNEAVTAFLGQSANYEAAALSLLA